MKIKNWAIRQLDESRIRADLEWRRPPRLTIGSSGGDPTVYYLAPSDDSPNGGVRVIYRHVDILNEMGIPAAVIHGRPGFRCSWFENSTRIVAPEVITIGDRDIVVVPECYGPGLALLPPSCRKVIFNQGAHHTFDRIAYEGTANGAPLTGIPGVLAILTVSEDSAELLRYAFPRLEVSVARNVIDSKIFGPRKGAGRRRIAYMPTRRYEELHEIRHVLRSSSLDDWTLTALSGLAEQEIANMLRTCEMFISLSDRDGFGLPAAEAMASGCFVVGYPGGGGREFFDAAFCSPVGSTTELIREVRTAIAMPDWERDAYGAKAADFVLGRYTLDGLRTDLQGFYGRFL